MSINLETQYKRVSGLPWQTVADQSLILNTEVKMAHEINAVGSFIWNRLDGELPLTQIIDDVCAEFEVLESVARQDVLDFVEELNQHQLVQCP